METKFMINLKLEPLLKASWRAKIQCDWNKLDTKDHGVTQSAVISQINRGSPNIGLQGSCNLFTVYQND